MATWVPKIVRATRNQNAHYVSCVVQSCDYSTEPRIIKNPTTASLQRGTGGRSSFNGIVCTIFGCSGFIGHSLAIRLGSIGTQLILPHRCDYYHVKELKVGGDLGQVFFHPFDLKDEESLIRTMKYSNVVVNLIGTRYETSNFSFEDVHVKGARELARIAKKCNVERFIHMSCLNAEENPKPMILSESSKLLKTKWKGEVAVREVFPEATIIRPSVVYGRLDNFLSHYMNDKRLLYSSKLPLWHKGEKTEKQPVSIHDVISGIVAIVTNPDTAGKTYQFVGPNRYTLRKLVEWMIDISMKHYDDEKLKVIDMRYHPLSWIKTTIWDNLYRVHPEIDLLWEVLEFHHATDKIDKSLPTLEDLGIIPCTMESRMEWEMLPYVRLSSTVTEEQRISAPKIQSIPK
ncbi:NADH:ubiquinone oxidoreductase subunit 39 [Xylocopa sonorina]|uniref:NADH:ubiquinone oxidoreductase subunit 39 n=1 Tax=Xylocopa sonorina TaxID=1818115 RepID=UPI00403AD29E